MSRESSPKNFRSDQTQGAQFAKHPVEGRRRSRRAIGRRVPWRQISPTLERPARPRKGGHQRRIARLAGFAVPALASAGGLLLGGVAGGVVAGLAVASAALGLVAERWLFFAEAKHTVILYYGADVA